jgi:hypothetical protein
MICSFILDFVINLLNFTCRLILTYHSASFNQQLDHVRIVVSNPDCSHLDLTILEFLFLELSLIISIIGIFPAFQSRMFIDLSLQQVLNSLPDVTSWFTSSHELILLFLELFVPFISEVDTN